MDMRFMSAAALLAGALALAGCGGGNTVTPGSETTPPSTTPPSTTPPSTTPPARPATLKGTGLTNSGSNPYDVRLEKDEKYETPNGGTITCPTDECVITVGAQRGTPVVTATGGATFAPKAVVRAPDRTAGGEDASVAWLADKHLLNAVKVTQRTVTGIVIKDSRDVEHELLDGKGTPPIADDTAVGAGGTFTGTDALEHDSAAGSAVGHVVIDALRGLETELRLVHTRGRTVVRASDTGDDRDDTLSDYLVFGTWETRTGADDGPRADPEAEVLVAGSLPFASNDLPTTGDARYEGKALGHYKRGKVGANDPWAQWNGTVELKANFSRGTSKISGSLKTGISDGGATLGDISLNQLTVGGSGKVSGVGTGTWNAGFYGTTINGAPNGVAGSFKTVREAARPEGTIETEVGGVTTVTPRPIIPGMIVQGAFGAHHVGQLRDQQQQGE